jgi:hypothetical protein
VGKYANFSWAVTRFTEAETTYVNSVYTGSGQYTDTNGNGTWSFTDTANLNFNLYGVGSYANGSFSFQTFNSSTSASISTDYQELGHGGGWVSYSTEVQTAHSMNLTELGQNQTGNYTLTLTDSMSQTFTGIPASGHTVSFTGSNSVTNTSTGAFSLVGGNPYFPPQSGWVIGSAGAGVGIAIPWYGNNPSGPMQSSGNRVTISLPGIHPSPSGPTGRCCLRGDMDQRTKPMGVAQCQARVWASRRLLATLRTWVSRWARTAPPVPHAVPRVRRFISDHHIPAAR